MNFTTLFQNSWWVFKTFFQLWKCSDGVLNKLFSEYFFYYSSRCSKFPYLPLKPILWDEEWRKKKANHPKLKRNLWDGQNMSKKPGQAFHTCSPEFKIHYQCSHEVPQFTLCCFLWVANKKSNISSDWVSLSLSFLNLYYCSVSTVYQQVVLSRDIVKW